MRPEGIMELEQQAKAPTLILSAREVQLRLRLMKFTADTEPVTLPGDENLAGDVKNLPSIESTHTNDIVSADFSGVTPFDIQNAVADVSRQKILNVAAIMDLFITAKEVGVPMQPAHYASIFETLLTNKRNPILISKMFDEVLELGIVPDAELWAQRVRALCKLDGPEAGLKMISRLTDSGVEACMSMFNAVLEQYVEERDFEKATKLWTRMHFEGELNTESFNQIFRKCNLAYEGERAVLYFKEMKALGVAPNEKTFCNFILACSQAPHWIHGFQDHIYEAILMMEGTEFVPTIDIYHAIIKAFARARDAKAAEYYFWEMRHKGFQPTSVTYNELLRAYAREQSVNHFSYGTPVS